MSSNNTITVERVRELLDYDPETGVLTWKLSRGSVRAGKIAGSIDYKGYRTIQVDGINYRSHRLAWVYVYGYWPPEQLDHINGVRIDNRIKNLRPVNQSESSRNMSRRRTNSSGTTGVRFNKRDKKWVARIGVNCKWIYLGYFDSKEDAVKVRKQAEKELGYHSNHNRDAQPQGENDE